MRPEIEIPETHSFDAVFERARKRAAAKRPKAALVAPTEIDTLKACIDAASRGLIEPIAIGDEAMLTKKADEYGLDIRSISMIDTKQPDMAVATAARMAHAAEIDLIVQGHIPVADMLAILFSRESNFRVPGKTVSHVAVLKPERYPKLLMVTDGAVAIQPDLQTKLNLIQNLLFVSEKIDIANPRIAIVTAVEVIYPQMPATMEAAILAKMAERGQIKGARVDGPLSFDVAIDMFAAHSKGIRSSPVAGQADAMVAPTIEVANGIYKALILFGRCDAGGIIVGGRVPVAVNSCADPQTARFNSIVLGALAS